MPSQVDNTRVSTQETTPGHSLSKSSLMVSIYLKFLIPKLLSVSFSEKTLIVESYNNDASHEFMEDVSELRKCNVLVALVKKLELFSDDVFSLRTRVFAVVHNKIRIMGLQKLIGMKSRVGQGRRELWKTLVLSLQKLKWRYCERSPTDKDVLRHGEAAHSNSAQIGNGGCSSSLHTASLCLIDSGGCDAQIMIAYTLHCEAALGSLSAASQHCRYSSFFNFCCGGGVDVGCVVVQMWCGGLVGSDLVGGGGSDSVGLDAVVVIVCVLWVRFSSPVVKTLMASWWWW
ncbi:unnamed protein product [Fraxinus pennsylvanica]|uniref:Uncharacterized protein n=1 Tax=Fraxinus pennsylvanica TaxID=56036 RepID=A0AAD1YS75_9LAMI|nr:unnamed protein product [Fraxinus pennsylvanica]